MMTKNCWGCVLNRVANARGRFCDLYCKPDDGKYFIEDDWSFYNPTIAPIVKLIANYYEHNGKEKTFEMMIGIRWTRTPTMEKINKCLEKVR